MTRIHCSMDELVAIRNGEGSSAAIDHLNSCEPCTEELERLHQRVAALKALPAVHPPRDRWHVVRAQVVGERRKRRRWVAGWVSAGTAASVALVLGALQLLPVVRATSEETDPYVALIEHSQGLEDMLRSMEAETRVLNGRTATAIAVLEDRLSALDVQLAETQLQRTDMMRLMQERIGLMDALVEVRRTKATYVGF